MNDNKHTFQITSSWVNLLREHSRNAIFPFVVHYSDKTCVSSLGSISQSLNHIWTLTTLQVQLTFYPYPPASKASREVAKITVRKNLHNPFKWFISMSVRLWQALTPIIDLSSKQNQKPFQKKFATWAAQAVFVSSFLLQNKWTINSFKINQLFDLLPGY